MTSSSLVKVATGPLCNPQRIDDLEKPEAVEITVAGHDPGNAVFAHQSRNMQVMQQITARFRQLVEALTENSRVPAGCGEHAQPGAGQQGLNKAQGRLAGPGVSVDARVGADAQEFVADTPGQKPRRGLSACFFDQFPARRVKFTVGIDRVQQHVGIDDEHATGSASLVHSLIQRIAVGYVDKRAAALPLRQRFLHLIDVLLGLVKHPPQARLDQLRHCPATPRGLLAQALHDAVIDIQGGFHMENHISSMAVFQGVSR